MAAQTTVPYDLYIREGGETTTPSVLINKHAAQVKVGSTITLTAETIPASQSVVWTSSATGKATVGESTGVVTGVEAGTTIITATITVDGVAYTDTCTVVVKPAT